MVLGAEFFVIDRVQPFSSFLLRFNKDGSFLRI
jgi:hypothetical protein